jgi:hypothetical protein
MLTIHHELHVDSKICMTLYLPMFVVEGLMSLVLEDSLHMDTAESALIPVNNYYAIG